ncbi:hypothetical protein [Micromonospora sp. B006]|uniref:hypothetical protein n=1 Tax=Micromonospora sp. B006 TaxID=2201999 RepID=UPI000E300C0B|nr:hypothetical protein [Micromonospora sp. B006]
MAIVAWPDRRADITNALSVLATLRPHGIALWPGLTEAVHWLIDDTSWDVRSNPCSPSLPNSDPLPRTMPTLLIPDGMKSPGLRRALIGS